MGVHPIFGNTFGALLRLFVRKVEGLENIPADKPFILAANHDSYLDPLLISVTITNKINHKLHWLAMKGRFWSLFGEKISHDWIGCVALDYGKKKAVNELISLLNNGENVGIFPGGPRSADGSLTRAKTGVSRLALGAKVPVIPVGLIGTYRIAPRDKLIPRFKRADIIIGKPIYFDKYYSKRVTKKLLREMANKVMGAIARLIDKRYDSK